MRAKSFAPVMRGIAAIMACVLVLTMVGAGVADTFRTRIDDALRTQSYVTNTDPDSARFKSDYATIDDMMAAAKALAIKEGEEGTVIMKNDNGALPLADGGSVALFGLAAYAPYPYTAGDLKAGNEDEVDLLQALTEAGIKVNETDREFYLAKVLNKHTEEVHKHLTRETESLDT